MSMTLPPTTHYNSNKNAVNCVKRALEDGIYTMLLNATSPDGESTRAMVAAIENCIRSYGADHLTTVVRQSRSTITPKTMAVVVIVYDRNRTNPYMNYEFRHGSIIIRDNRRAVEQTVQLIYDAKRNRPELHDLIIHTCATQQNNKRRFLIIMCRGKDDYKRVFYKKGKRVRLHDNPEKDEGTKKHVSDKYQEKCLRRFGNTVADPKFIRRLGVEGTAKKLSELVGEEVRIRKCQDFVSKEYYYLAETRRRWKDD